MPENLTKEQDLAVNLKRHISVKANAGSGKTKVLVDRYIRILEDSYTKTDIAKITPYEIVAMTFTRKAAGEMLKKVVDKIEKLKTDSPTTDQKNLSAYAKIRNDLNAARISTIHSFASSLLRDFAVEANVNPNFIELTDSNKHRIKNEAFEYVITKIYQEPNNELHKPLISFIDRYSIKILEDFANSLSYSKEFLNSLNKRGFYDQSNDEILEYYKPLFIEMLDSKLQELFHFTELAFDYTADNVGEGYLSKRDSFLSIVKNHNLNANRNFENLQNYFNELSLIYTGKPVVEGKKKGLPTYFTENCSEVFNFEYNKVNEKIKKNYLINFDEISNSTLIQVEDAKFVLAFANQVLQKTDEEKQKYAYLDFDDILIKTDELLSNPEVAQKISSKIKYIMVDEFQDTNPTQYSILKKLEIGRAHV